MKIVNQMHAKKRRTGKRKIARPICTKRPMHIVLKSTQATGSWGFHQRRHKGLIHLAVLDVAKRFHIRLEKYENGGNHLHLVVQAKKRHLLQNFLRVLPQKIAFLVTGTRKGAALRRRFWSSLAYSRVVSWGRELRTVKTYLFLNALEGFGLRKEAERLPGWGGLLEEWQT